VECTPKNLRLRKRTLDSSTRQREKKKMEAEIEAAG
jgi:predicted membrane GTPase involved in stress response